MTSYFARYRSLSEETRNAFQRQGSAPTVSARVNFYYYYLRDVVPRGVNVRHVPAVRLGVLPRDINTREEIQLLTPSGMIFMSGLVCTQTRTDNVELVAADEAYTRWRDGDFVPDGQNWRFFTGQVEIRFFNSRSRGEEWEMVDNFNPITHVAYVAAYLQREYDRLRVH